MPFGTNITIPVEKLLTPVLTDKLSALSNEMKIKLSDLLLKTYIEKIWQKFYKPIKLTEDPMAYLYITPVSIGINPPVLNSDNITLMPCFVTKLIVRLGEPVNATNPLPLQLITNNAHQDGFSASVRFDIPFSSLNDELKDKIVGNTFESVR